MADIDVEDVLSKLSRQDKIGLLSAIDFWHTHPVHSVGIPSLRCSDGPNGVRGTRMFNSVPSACFPCGTGLGATWNTSLLHEAGKLMGNEAKAKGAHILLGPCINMQRGPLGGRGFESISEDPVLAGLGAAAIVEGIQETGVAACIKHFVCNDQEHERNGVDAIVTERALREIYLKPFQIAVRDARPATFMSSYNKINGTHVSENPKILKEILRGEWGWRGAVMSDWFGTYSTAAAINAGLDLEMPGSTRWRGTILGHTMTANKVAKSTLDERVKNVLELVKRCSKSGVPENQKEGTNDTPETSAFMRKVASEAVVLMKNNAGVLPLKKDKPVILIGPNAKTSVFCGGGSSAMTPYYAVSPYEGIKEKIKEAEIKYTVGAYSHKELPLVGKYLETPKGEVGFLFKAYNDPPSAKGREVSDTLHLVDSNMVLVDYKPPNIKGPIWYADIEGIFTPEEDGEYDFGISVNGTGQLFVDGKLLVDNKTTQRKGNSFFGSGTVEEIGTMKMKKDQEYQIKVEFGSGPTSTLIQASILGNGGVRIGCARKFKDPQDEIDRAVKLATSNPSAHVIICCGLNSEWESEGYDRADMSLPGHTDALISAVSKANPNTVVVMQSGTPVEMPWLSSVSSLVHAWYGGNETGNAIADVLYGDVNPSGKLPLSFPHKVQDNPAYLNFRCEGGRTLYGEDIYIGYRYYDAVSREVAFSFGHGLSYTTFSLSNIKVSKSDTMVSVSVNVKNTGSVLGAEVVQVYIQQRNPSIRRPRKELQGFGKAFVEPGMTANVEVGMELKYATGFWDEEREMWVCEKDAYTVLVGTGSQGPFLEGSFEIDGTFWWEGI